jgi:hypothetical protein
VDTTAVEVAWHQGGRGGGIGMWQKRRSEQRAAEEL